MPYVYKHRRPPERWAEARSKSLHRVLIPAYFLNWIGDWVAYFLGKWSIFELLEYVGSFSILVAVVFYFADAGDRLKLKHYQAWQVINTAQGKGGSGGRIEALQELNEDHVPLVGVDVSDAYLQEIRLPNADLRRSELRGGDLRRAILLRANLEGSNLHSTNLRSGDLREANFIDVRLIDADLGDADLSGATVRGADFSRADLRNANLQNIKDWREIKSIQLANIYGVRNPPEGFEAWARKNGAVALKEDSAWEAAQSPSQSTTVPAVH